MTKTPWKNCRNIRYHTNLTNILIRYAEDRDKSEIFVATVTKAEDEEGLEVSLAYCKLRRVWISQWQYWPDLYIVTKDNFWKYEYKRLEDV